MSWVLIVITVIVTDCFFLTTDHRGVVCHHLVGDSPCVRTTCIPSWYRAYSSMLSINTGKECTASDCVQCGLTQVVLLRTCTSVTNCTHLYCLLPCVRLCCGLYPHGFTVWLSWLAPLCESPLRTVSTRAYSFAALCESLLQIVSTRAYCFTVVFVSEIGFVWLHVRIYIYIFVEP